MGLSRGRPCKGPERGKSGHSTTRKQVVRVMGNSHTPWGARCEQRRLSPKGVGIQQWISLRISSGVFWRKLGVYSERSRRVKRLNPYLSARSCLLFLGAQERTGELQRFIWQQMDKINDDHFAQERDRIRLIHLFWKGIANELMTND